MPANHPAETSSASGAVRLLEDALRQPASNSSAKHIVLLLDGMPKVLGGGERVVLRTARQLLDAGYRVSIVTFAVLCDPETLRGAPVPILLLPISGVFQWAALRAAWQFGRFLRRERVVLVQTYFESANLFGGLAAKALSRARLVWNRRDMGILRERKHRIAYRLLRRLPDHVIAVSNLVRRHAIAVDGIPARRVTVIYNGLDLREPAAAEAEAMRTLLARAEHPGPLVVTVGNLRPVKGQDVLVEAAAAVLRTHPDARFAIAGGALDEAFYQQLQQRVAALGLQDKVLFLGAVNEPTTLLDQADIFVLPSRSEGFSNAIVEAMAAGLPAVVTAVGGNAEAVEDGFTGRVVPPEDPAALAAAMADLLSHPEERHAMGAAGKQRAEALFTSAAMLRATEALYKGLHL